MSTTETASEILTATPNDPLLDPDSKETEKNEGSSVSEGRRTRILRPAPHVYSCFVVNKTDHPIDCVVHYDGRPNEDTFNEDIHVSIPADDEKYFPRKHFQPDLPKSYCEWVKIITRVRVIKHDQSVLEINYPFENVRRPIRNWEFHVHDDDKIQSMPPTRKANLFKHENLDQYEC